MVHSGKILRVDLTERKIETEPTSSYFRKYVGGLSIGTKILYDGVPADVSGTDPKNMLIFSTGPLTGTLLGNKSVLVTKSPLWTNKTIGNGGMGGQFPSEMRFAGYDHIVVTGKAEKPVYLYINNDEVEIKDAGHIWGSDVYKAQEMIKDELKDPDVQIATIGQAGENMVTYSMVVHDIDHTASRVGHGAVMGSKNLKAVAVRGTGGIKIADPEKFMALWQDYWDYYTKGDGKLAWKLLNKEGVAVHYDMYQETDIMAWGNFDSWVVPPPKKEDRMANFMNKYMVGRIGCSFCPVQCHDNFEVEGIGYGSTCMNYPGWHWNIKVQDLKKWYRISKASQRHGMEALTSSGIVSWLMDLYEKGIITEKDTDGIAMEWGSEEACLAIIEKMAKREGIGDILADGILAAANHIGKDSIELAVQYRNNVIHPGFAPIGATAGIHAIPGASEVWTHPVGGDFWAMVPWFQHELGISEEEAEKMVADNISDFSEKTTGDRDAWREDNYEKHADFEVVNETAISACDISGHCEWNSDRVPQCGMWWGPEEVAQAITAVTGRECTEEMLVDAHKRRRLLEFAYGALCARVFNEEEAIPIKLMMPRQDGRFEGAIPDFEKMPTTSQRYFELMKIDSERQVPLRSELERLGMEDVADMLEKEGLAEPPETKEEEAKKAS